MKKCLSIALVFILLAPAVILAAWREIDSGKEEIYVMEEILSGDPAAAEGITLEIASHWDRRLLWNTSYTVGSGKEAQTSFHFSPLQVYWDYKNPKNANLWLFNRDHFTVENVSTWRGEYSEIIRELEEEQIPPGTGYTETVRIGDYYEYYPLTMDIENVSVYYGDVFNNGFYSDFLTEFFHISTGEDRIELTLERKTDGTLSAVIGQRQSADSGDIRIELTGASAFAENGFYYSYTCENLSGEILDRGQETGIFFFPYRMEKNIIHIELEQVRKVQEQPEGWNPVQMLLDEEKGYLYLTAAGEEGYALFIYRLEGEELNLVRQVSLRQRETTEEGEEVLPYFRQMTAEQGGLLITWSDNGFVFVTGEGGTCRTWCSGVFPRDTAGVDSAGAESMPEVYAQEYRQDKEAPFPVANACVFDGERLVLAGFEAEDSLNVLLAVYDESGELYSGLYRHSSELDTDTDEFGRRRILSQVNRNWMVLGARQKPVDSPLKITMEK